jgi:hypothetical protein
VFTLSALGIIVEAEIGLAPSIAAYLAYVALAQIVLIAAVLVCAIAPQASSALLRRAVDWLACYSRPISITVAVVFGAFFLWHGVTGLLA